MMRDNCFWQILLAMTAKAEMTFDPSLREEDQIAPFLEAGEGTGEAELVVAALWTSFIVHLSSCL